MSVLAAQSVVKRDIILEVTKHSLHGPDYFGGFQRPFS